MTHPHLLPFKDREHFSLDASVSDDMKCHACGGAIPKHTVLFMRRISGATGLAACVPTCRTCVDRWSESLVEKLKASANATTA